MTITPEIEELYGKTWAALCKKEGHKKALPPTVLTTADRSEKFGQTGPQRDKMIMEALRKAPKGRKFNASALQRTYLPDLTPTAVSRGLLHLWSLDKINRRKVYAASTRKVRHSLYWLKE